MKRNKLNECGCGCGGTSSACMQNQEKPESYMFFGNLQTIRRAVDAMMQMDPEKVDHILQDGHNWAADHIATSKDDIEEVAGFLMNEMETPYLAQTFESYSSVRESWTDDPYEKLAEDLQDAIKNRDWQLVKKVAFSLRYVSMFGKLPSK
jgi:hypothetical protein